MESAANLVDLQKTLYTSRNPTRRWLHCSRRDWICDAIERYRTQSETHRALEVGPGSGTYLPVLGRCYEEVVACDIEEAYLAHARQLADEVGNLHIVKDDITATNLSPRSFDLILCSEVVEHISDSRTAISQMHSLLRPGGRLILSTPQRYSPLECAAKIAFLPGVIQAVRLVYREPILETGHINLMTEKVIRAQLLDAGFEVEEAHKFGVYVPLLAEFAGKLGLFLEKSIENPLRNSRLNWLLWTQCYVARAKR